MAEWVLVQAQGALVEAGLRLARVLAAIHVRRGSARLAIAGGSALAALETARTQAGNACWRGLQVTWTDERCVPFAHPDSNRGEAFRRGLLSAQDPVGDLLPLFLDGEDPAQACTRAQRELASRFSGGLDAVLLGLGEDGHIASLFPGHAWLGPPHLAQLVADSPKPPSCRITLSLSLLASAEYVVLVAFGASKREALRRLAKGDSALPAVSLPRLIVITDQEGLREG